MAGMTSLKSHLLAASPKLPDTNFFRTVVLMIQHDENGAFGVVLNRPTDVTVADVWEKVAEEPCDSQQIIRLGGPVAGPLMAVHSQMSCSETQILPGVYFATQKDYLNQIVRQEQRPYLLFSGYAGWSAGQLESELTAGGWLTTPANEDYIFFEGDDLWERVVKEIGHEIMAPAIKSKHVPSDPSLN